MCSSIAADGNSAAAGVLEILNHRLSRENPLPTSKSTRNLQSRLSQKANGILEGNARLGSKPACLATRFPLEVLRPKP